MLTQNQCPLCSRTVYTPGVLLILSAAVELQALSKLLAQFEISLPHPCLRQPRWCFSCCALFESAMTGVKKQSDISTLHCDIFYMRVLQISAQPYQHKNQCISAFLHLWFQGQSEGDNPIARGLKFSIQPKIKISLEDITNLVRKGLIYYNQKKVPHLPFKAQGKCKFIVALPEDLFVNQKSESQNNKNIKPSSSLNSKNKLNQKHIVFEDQDMVIINKPSGLPSQSTLDIFEDHALSQLLSYYIEKDKGLKAPYLNLMHRLDKDTSGLLIFSKKISANKNLTALFESRKIKKTYLAVVLRSENYKLNETFKVSGLIRKDPQPGMSFYFSMSPTEGQTSESDFKVLSENDKYFLLECSPKTGRSHQLRVHLKSVGLPILGDVFYNPGSKYNRLMLHAWSLQFKHPINGQDMTVKAPESSEFKDLGFAHI
jgi:23S rRNA pseudouridine1911/1915/1917 synthase